MTTTVLRNVTLVRPGGIEHGDLRIVDGRIAAREHPALGDDRIAANWSPDLTAHWVLPGLVNAHDHLQLNGMPPLPVGAQSGNYANSTDWIDAWRQHMADPTVAAARRLSSAARHWQGALKNLLSGATTVAHHDPADPSFDDPRFPVRLLRRFGWSHSLGLGMPRGAAERPGYGPAVGESHAATPVDWPWIIHLAEGVDEAAAEELDLLEELGCLTGNTVLVHGVALTRRSIGRILEVGAAVVWCPSSNLGLFGRTLDPRPLIAAGRVALGTDSRLSGSTDLLEELRIAAGNSDCTRAELFNLVTAAASRILRLPDVGDVAPGYHADLMVIRQQGDDPHAALLRLRRADIRAVIRNGVPAVADPDFADWFAACGIPSTEVRIDGRRKLMATAVLGAPGTAGLEPGLEVIAAD